METIGAVPGHDVLTGNLDFIDQCPDVLAQHVVDRKVRTGRYLSATTGSTQCVGDMSGWVERVGVILVQIKVARHLAERAAVIHRCRYPPEELQRPQQQRVFRFRAVIIPEHLNRESQ